MGSPAPKAALDFYSALFGWEGQDMGEESGHYTIVSKGGKQVAAIGPAQDPGPPRWTTYVNVHDVDSAAKKAEAAGGTVLVAPMDVFTSGRMAVFKDTTGAVIAAWQPARPHWCATRQRGGCIYLGRADYLGPGEVESFL